jgi:XTP/dITP diphosphohydrolase
VGECRGEIALAPTGTSGFGYDPIFLVPSLGKTFAELTFDEKNQHSHRAQAFARMQAHLGRLLR